MTITKELLESRLADLDKQYQAKLGDLHAINGAIQDTRFWLQTLEKQEIVVELPPELADVIHLAD